MDHIRVASTTTEIWQGLVAEAEQESELVLGHEVEGYLVMTLIRYQGYAQLQSHVLALDYFNAHHQSGQQQRQQRLQQLGDISLLFSGLFPEQADRRMVGQDYFIKMGRSAYGAAAAGAARATARIYSTLAERFITVSRVLRVVHDYTTDSRPNLLEAWDLWSGLRDHEAWQRLTRNGAIPVIEAGTA